MARRTKGENDDMIEIFYGINSETFAVESVSLTRGRMLQKYGAKGEVTTHFIFPGRSSRAEIVAVWGLTELISFHPGLYDGAYTQRRINELAKRAKEKKKAAVHG